MSVNVRCWLHYGVWYDDPAELPSFVAYNYARAEGQTWTDGCATLLEQLRLEIERRLQESGVTEERASGLSPLFGAVQWFTTVNEHALATTGRGGGRRTIGFAARSRSSRRSPAVAAILAWTSP
jgi:hypothetical protein